MGFETVKDQHGNPRKHPVFKKFLRNHLDQLIIPGTSIRGVIRSVAETMSNSCLTLFEGDYDYSIGPRHYRAPYANKVDDTFKHQNCKIADGQGKPITAADQGMCMCCRIFGMANEQEQDTKTDDPILRNVFASKVIFSDAILQTKDKIDPQSITFKELSSPKPHHAPFYIENNQIKGRKFYYHQSDSLSNCCDPNNQKTQRNQTIRESITKEAQFTFEVTFMNLTDQELGLLLWALELDEKRVDDPGPMAHKIGMGKPIGLGSIKIQVTGMEIIEPAKRYTSFGSGNAVFENKALRGQITTLRDAYKPNPFASLPELKNILTFDFTSGDSVYYPGRNWFQQDSRLRAPTELPADGKLNDPPGSGTTSPGSGTSRGAGARSSSTPSSPTPPRRTTQPIGESMRSARPPESQKSSSEEMTLQVKRINNKSGKVFVEINGQEIALANPPYGIQEHQTIEVRVDRDPQGRVTVTYKPKGKAKQN